MIMQPAIMNTCDKTQFNIPGESFEYIINYNRVKHKMTFLKLFAL